jgi:hypothetical protein
VSAFEQISSHTLRFKCLTEEDVNASELIIAAADATENRGQLSVWNTISSSHPERVLWVKQTDREQISVQRGEHEEIGVALRDEGAINELLSSSRILVDISGLQHHVWAPILKSAYARHVHTRILYAEPESYKLHPSPASATLFDLSIKFDGLAPLPGFARLIGPADENRCLFVAMLGFEGNRPERLVLQVDPIPKVIPVVGVPGFQLEFPAFTVACNRVFLDEYRAHSEVRYARASCPFEAYDALCEIRKDYPDHFMYLAPVGTKPHALGTILFAIKNPDTTEIMFDHPVRKAGRTKGIGVIHIYDFGTFDAS